MKNFKSFRNAQIPFTRGFTAIAGANGSGKSNIMDAVLFALGETSLKSLRAARLTDLVHSGTATDNYAVVTLTLEGKDQTYELSRTIDKQGKSVYRLNEKRVTLSEIQNLLHELGLRVDGHNLVSQGDLLRIIDMNPVERRELIDEVAGIQEFDEKKNEAVRDLDKVDRKIKDVTIVLNERMAIIEQLGRERDAATRFKKLEKELRETKSTILHLESGELNHKLEGILAKQVELIERKEEAIQKQQFSRKLIVEAEKEFSELDAKVIGVKTLAYGGLGKSVEEHRAEIRVLEERIRQHHTRIQSLNVQMEHGQKSIHQAQHEITQKDSQLQDLHSRAKEIEKEMGPLKAQQEESLQKKKEILQKAEKLEKETHVARGKVSQTREKLAHLQARTESQQKEASMLEGMTERLEQQHTRLEKEKEGLQKDLQELEKIKKKHADVGKARQQLAKKIEEIEHHLAEHTGKAMAHAESLAQLKKSKSNCPICERELKHEHKQTLTHQKEKAIEEAQKIAAKAEKERKELREEWEQLHEAETLLTRFEKSQVRARTLNDEMKLVESEIQNVKTKRKAISPESFTKEKHALNEELMLYQKEMEKTEHEWVTQREKLNQVGMDHQVHSLHVEQVKVERELYRIELDKEMNGNTITQSKARVTQLKEEEKNENEHLKTEEKKHGELEKELANVEKKFQSEMSANKGLLDQREKVQQKLAIERERERAWQEKVFRIEGQVSEFKIEQSKYDTRLLDVKEELKNYVGVGTLDKTDILDLKKHVPVLEHEIKQVGTVNMKSLEDFGQYEKDVLDIREKANTLTTERLAVMDLINGIELKRNEAFMKTFNAINTNFNTLYTSFFNGTAKLELTNPQKPLESGLIVEAKHGVEKFLKNIDSMSGGEKSLTSLAFIFSIQLFEPAPFYFFDEVDAALDMTNSRKVGELIKEMSKSSQFISITHNDNIVKVADQILGVTKSGGTHSSVIGLKNAGEVKITNGS